MRLWIDVKATPALQSTSASSTNTHNPDATPDQITPDMTVQYKLKDTCYRPTPLCTPLSTCVYFHSGCRFPFSMLSAIHPGDTT